MTPNSWVPQPAAPAPQKPNRMPLVLSLVGAGVFLFCVVPGGCLAYFASLPEAGVRAGNQVPKESLAHIKAHVPFEEGEEVVSYFDHTVSVNGTECSLLTNKRVVDWKGNDLSQMQLSDVKRLDHASDTMVGDLIDLTDAQGKNLHIEIAPLNDGDRFLAALERSTGLKANERAKKK